MFTMKKTTKFCLALFFAFTLCFCTGLSPAFALGPVDGIDQIEQPSVSPSATEDPLVPETPDVPSDLEDPGTSDDAADPKEPEDPKRPAAPEDSEIPDDPALPNGPENAEDQVDTEKTESPVNPEVPEEPSEIPEDPSVSEGQETSPSQPPPASSGLPTSIDWEEEGLPIETSIVVATAEDLENAIKGATNPLTIVMNSTITLTNSITVDSGKDITLDLNGNTLSYEGNGIAFNLFGSTFTICDSMWKDPADIDIEEVTYNVTKSQVNGTTTTETKESHTVSVPTETALEEIGGQIQSSTDTLFQVANQGRLILESGVLNPMGHTAIWLYNDSSVEMNGGWITNSNTTAISMTSGANSSITINGGYLTNNSAGWKGGAIAATAGNIYINGGIIANNSASFGGGIAAENGTLTITDGYIVNNTSLQGGGIAVGNETVTINGGVIASNTVRDNKNHENDWGSETWGGGGLYAEGSSQITMTGGIIANNTAEDSPTYNIGGDGGGIYLNQGSSLTMSGGSITENYAGGATPADAAWSNSTSGGGGIYANIGTSVTLSDQAQITANRTRLGGGGVYACGAFTMNGGIVAGNTAENNEGGGLYLCPNKSEETARISAGYITGNRTETTQHWGGGGIFLETDSLLHLQNALFTGNEADGFGGGVGGCSTGLLVLTIQNGIASFDNVAKHLDAAHSGSLSGKHYDQIAANNDTFMANKSNDFFCANQSIVFDMMLGGGLANWTGTQDRGAGYDIENQTIDVQLVNTLNNPFAVAKYLMGLTANPTEDAKLAAFNAATVFITGNTSATHGGGIMANGILLCSDQPTDQDTPIETTIGSVKLPVQKILQNTKTEQGESLTDGQFRFVLANGVEVKDGKVTPKGPTQTFTNNADGTINIHFPLTQVGVLTFYLLEVEGTDENVTYDPTVYQLKVDVREAEDKVDTWIGSTHVVTTILNGTVAVNVMNLVEDSLEEGNVVGLDKITFTNYYTPPEDPEPIYTSLTVKKTWVNDTEQTRPESIQVQLYKDGTAEGSTVLLNAANDWAYTWTQLLSGFAWTVSEVDVPKGYTSTVSDIVDGVVTITNTWTPSDPIPDPGDPSDPGEPEEPGEPEKPTPSTPDRDRPSRPDPEPPAEIPDPEVPLAPAPEEPPVVEIPEEDVPLAGTPEEPIVDIPDEDVPLVSAPPVTTDIPDQDVPLADVPKTGDASGMWYATAALALCGLAVLKLRREGEER